MRTIGALIFDGFELLDLYGPLEMFGMMPAEFSIKLLAENAGPIASGAGPQSLAESISHARDIDILLVPGGPGTRRDVDNQRVLDWIAATSGSAELTLSVCTGSALLAKAGVLDGKRATTNKAAFQWVAEQGPQVEWVKQARWVGSVCQDLRVGLIRLFSVP